MYFIMSALLTLTELTVLEEAVVCYCIATIWSPAAAIINVSLLLWGAAGDNRLLTILTAVPESFMLFCLTRFYFFNTISKILDL